MEQDSLSKLLNGILLKKYSCINDIVVLYNEITPNAYVVTVYVIPVSSSKGFEAVSYTHLTLPTKRIV